MNAVHPGIADTEIMRHMSFFKSTTAAVLLKPIIWPFVKTPKQASMTPVFVALDPSLDKVSGKYFV